MTNLASHSLIWRAFLIAALITAAGCASRMGPSDATASTNVVIPHPQVPRSDVDPTVGSSSSSHDEVQYIDGVNPFLVSLKGPAPQSQPSVSGEFDLNFLDTDVQLVVEAVLNDMLGLEFSVDPRVEGSITLQSNRALSASDVLLALEESLRLINVAIVRNNNVYHVIPLREAPRRITSIRRPVPANVNVPGFGVEAVKLTFTTPSEMAEILAPFAAEGAILTVDDSRNLMLLAGTARELATLQDLVRTFDVDWMKGKSLAIYSLDHVDAETAKSELELIFGSSLPSAGQLIRLIPLRRINSLIAISHNLDYLRRIASWIERLDRGGHTGGRKIYVYHVQYGKADAIGESLSRIFGRSAAGTDESQYLSGGAEDAVYSGDAEKRFDLLGGQQLKIVPNVDNNSLLILATAEEYSVIESALERIDLPPRQVMLEATLAEVTLNEDLRYGVNWFFESGANTFTFSSSGTGAISPTFPGFSFLHTDTGSSAAVLNALSSITDVDVVSSPKLLVINNQTATLQVGDQVPVAVQSVLATTDPNAPLVNTIQFRDTGVILTITPHINEGGLIVLEVSQEVSEVTETRSSGIDSPTIQQRRIQSTIAVQNGQSIALGGLIRETRSTGESGIPVLMKIPLIGNLFSTTSHVIRRTELIIIITPRIVTNAYQSRQTLLDLQEEFEKLRPLLPESAFRNEAEVRQ